MYICQPPPKEMQLWPSCCGETTWRHQLPTPARDTVRNDTGITIGDLFDKAKDVVAKHRHCPHASMYQHSKGTGEVIADVFFATEIELDTSDPFLEEKKETIKKDNERKNADKAWTTRLRAYTAAKQAAVANGTPIPTLEEFEASQYEASI